MASGRVAFVVEDEDGIRAIVSNLLETRGFTVCSASNGRDALDQARNAGRPADLLVTDLHMPEMDGASLIAALALESLLPSLTLVISSDVSNPAVVSRITGSAPVGRFRFLAKPFRLKDFEAALF